MVDRYVEHGAKVLEGREASPPPIMAWSAAASLGGRIELGVPPGMDDMLTFPSRG